MSRSTNLYSSFVLSIVYQNRHQHSFRLQLWNEVAFYEFGTEPYNLGYDYNNMDRELGQVK